MTSTTLLLIVAMQCLATFRAVNAEEAVTRYLTGARAQCRWDNFLSTSRRSSADNLRRLREEMASRQIDAYIILDTDEHQSPGVARRDRRLQFMSGFSGTSGQAAVSLRHAALWTDSRYFLQADQELQGGWQLMRTGVCGTPSVAEWLSTVLVAGDVVASDPKIAPYSQWSSLERGLNRYNITMKLIHHNLVDVIWENRREHDDQDERIFVLPIQYAGQTWQQKILRLKETLLMGKVDTIVLSKLDEVAWLLNLRGNSMPHTPVFHAYFIMRDDCATLYVDEDKVTPEVIQHLHADSYDCLNAVRIQPYNSFWDDLTIAAEEAGRVWLPSPLSITKGVSYLIYKTIPATKRYFRVSPILNMKAWKNDVEAQGMRNAHIRDAVAVCQMLAMLEDEIERGASVWDELSVAKMLEEFRLKQDGNHGISFETVSAFGPNAASPHYKPTKETNLIIDDSALLMIDSGGQYLDGTTDVTRTLHYGTPTDEYRTLYTSLLMGCIDLVSAIFPKGCAARMLDILIRRNLFQLGLDYGHSSIHGIGSFLDVHEAFNSTYYENFFGSQEPGYYRENEFGMRLENIVTVVPAPIPEMHPSNKFLSFEPVTLVPYESKLINLAMMTRKQIEWLNNYHQRVRRVVGAEMLKQGLNKTYDWLMCKTQLL